MRFFAVLVCLPPLLGLVAGVVDKWTPANFPWDSIDVGPPESWKGLTMNLSDPLVEVTPKALAIGQQRNVADGSVALAIPFAVGLVWNVFNAVLTGAGLAGAITGCQQNMGSPSNIFYCVTGLISSVIGIGSAASAAKQFANSRGWFGVAANAWSNSGIENIALNVFSKREYIDIAEETAQKAHNHFLHNALRSLSVTDPVFLGYAPEFHRLAKRDSEVHPFAPMFRFTHAIYGMIDLTSRDLGSRGMYFTIAYAEHPTHIRRDEYFEHERLDSMLLEA